MQVSLEKGACGDMAAPPTRKKWSSGLHPSVFLGTSTRLAMGTVKMSSWSRSWVG